MDYRNTTERALLGATVTALLLGSSSIVQAQDSTVTVPTSVMNTIGTVLPERSNAGAAYVSDSYSPNVVVTQDCNISVVFVWEGAGYHNSLGYFTYQDNNDGSVTILSSDLILANASFPGAGSAATGDVHELKDAAGATRTFTAGEKVGFFIVADGSRRSTEVQNWTFNQPGVPSTDPATNRFIGRGLYTSINQLNPERSQGSVEMSRHLAMIWMPAETGFLDDDPFLLCGFEDLNRTANSDDDFNDCVFIVTANPIEAIEDTPGFNYQPGDPDGDGVSGINDHFPDDPDRATLTRYPSTGNTVLAFEDNYPDVGDADYNDAVFAYSFEVVKDANGDVKDIAATFSLVARGAAYDHGLGLHIPGLPGTAAGTMQIERFASGIGGVNEVITDRTVAQFIAAGNRVEDIFASTTASLPPPSGETFTNTLYDPESANGADARVMLTFTTAIDPSAIGDPPYDPFLALNRYGNGIWDVHLPGNASFADRSTHLPTESGANAFMDADGYPWAIEIPSNWRFPMESVHIGDAYAQFHTWRTSGGTSSTSWYDSPTTTGGRVSAPLADIVPVREWTVAIPR